MKRMLAIVLTVLMTLSLCPAFAEAAQAPDEAAALETARAIFPAAECPPDGHTIRLAFPESNPNGGNA